MALYPYLHNSKKEVMDFTLTVNGTSYELTDVNSIEYNNPEETHLIRGLNSKDEQGLKIRSNTDQPTTITITTLMIKEELAGVLREEFQNNGSFSDIVSSNRISIHFYDKEKKKAINKDYCVLVNDIEQRTYGGSADDMQTVITLETFDGRQ
jgi:hypothetical protein